MPAFLLSPLIRWGAVALVVAVLSGLLWVEHGRRVNADRAAVLSAADAKRWEAASNDRDESLRHLNGILTHQNETIESQRLDAAMLEAASRENAANAGALQSQVDSLTEEVRNAQKQHPESVHALGPVACDVYRRLYGATAACVHP